MAASAAVGGRRRAPAARHNAGVDPFSVLGVPETASEAELASAYRELAKEWHPDRRGGEGVHRMAEINAAYELLRAGAQQERTRPRRPAPGRRPRGRAGGCRTRCGGRWARSSSMR